MLRYFCLLSDRFIGVGYSFIRNYTRIDICVEHRVTVSSEVEDINIQSDEYACHTRYQTDFYFVSHFFFPLKIKYFRISLIPAVQNVFSFDVTINCYSITLESLYLPLTSSK